MTNYVTAGDQANPLNTLFNMEIIGRMSYHISKQVIKEQKI